ncbi:hypothetical protein HMPREF7215_1474 [Pyramidobacter piscolens W5455]|uniref:Uncharacterized protein n=1 Tax=Pyramidobacter piscolens W5455 TaxID=352165 RepID=A0ABM9ZXD4_9BACT|nr:hypothetical protein HMPREF7215_1474 [Pyramidobacter piscolens W5455]
MKLLLQEIVETVSSSANGKKQGRAAILHGLMISLKKTAFYRSAFWQHKITFLEAPKK